MLDKPEIHAVGKELGFTPWQAEKDYLQHLFLRELYSRISDELVFKGGTCLQKAYDLHRFSRDLDFNRIKPGIVAAIPKIAKKLGQLLPNRLSRTEETPYSSNFLIEFDSAIRTNLTKNLSAVEFANSTTMKNSLTIQISKREKLQMIPKQVAITPRYANIPPYFVVCMDETEIAAEKIRAIYQRAFPRDVYDLWFLLRKGILPPLPLINKKLAQIRVRYQRGAFLEKVAGISAQWGELKDLLPAYPAFGNVQKEIEEKISERI